MFAVQFAYYKHTIIIRQLHRIILYQEAKTSAAVQHYSIQGTLDSWDSRFTGTKVTPYVHYTLHHSYIHYTSTTTLTHLTHSPATLSTHQSVLLGSRSEPLLQPILLVRLVEIREDHCLDDTHSRHRPVDKASGRLHPKLLFRVVLAGEVGPEGEGEHGGAVQEELQEHSPAAGKGLE